MYSERYLEIFNADTDPLDRQLEVCITSITTKNNENKKMQLKAGVPGKKPSVTSDKLLDSPSKLPCIPL